MTREETDNVGIVGLQITASMSDRCGHEVVPSRDRPAREEQLVQPPARVEEQLAKVADRLASEYADRVPEPIVRDLVRDAYVPLSTARVTQFVPVLVDRTVRESLRHRSA